MFSAFQITLIYRQSISVFLAAFPTSSIRVPRVMLSIQTRYTPTASKVDNNKQIPQLLFIVLRRCSNIVVLQQTQESAVIVTSRNNRNPVLVLPLYLKKPAADRFLIPTTDFATIFEMLELFSPRLVCVTYPNDDVAPRHQQPVDTLSINRYTSKSAVASYSNMLLILSNRFVWFSYLARFNDTQFLNHPTLPEEIRAHN
ncbi:hypothetical protein F511_44244 [Dorcoceras hygrometricum]|uniref:Uncharacterized protein n=1 Tax=Dorcoceras hygrometricum TaxID=472368 RepID=A0A2Z7A5B4_9LAMI|nr:hypothetical protein F511_44244 [Dorcoceras hygrometricum]